ncbi:MAG: RNA methyltransferase [Bacteroidetes bacterium]|nr:RNA methyltransferase [Bacteroidota bacterium]
MRKLLNEELNRKSLEEFKLATKTPIVIVLDNVRSLNNVGSVFRTADAFLVEAVYLCGITGTPPNKDIQKTALGSTDSVSWKYFKTTLEALEVLKQNNYDVYAIEQTQSAIMLNDFKPDKSRKLAIVFGNEVKGVEQAAIDASIGVIEIPQVGTKHSLNIAVSVGVVTWDLFQKMI